MIGVIGTAGHIDHGKTSLVRALTGTDCDRLPEEKRRGITIALGFARLVLPDGRSASVVDVPGHEKFVRTMVSGASGVDLCLFVVAADEGMMPQSREHLEICGWLGIRRGVIALTKVDKAGAELSELAADEVSEALEASTLRGSPIVPVSARTGEGLEALRSALAAGLEGLAPPVRGGSFFLPVDRVFSVKGFGTIATGTPIAGKVAVGDTLVSAPGPHRPEGRVRSIEAFGAQLEEAGPGQRLALALAGLDTEQVRPGQVLLPADRALQTQRLSVRIHHAASHPRPLKTGARCHLHIGTTAVAGVGLTLFSVDELKPGESGLATLRLPEPVVALPRQRFVLRGDDAPGVAGRTIGGGEVLDPEPPRRRRRDPSANARLEILGSGKDFEAAVALLEEAGPRGLPPAALERRLGERPEPRPPIVVGESRWAHAGSLSKLKPRLLEMVARFHEERPLEPGVGESELCSRFGRPLDPLLLRRLVEEAVADKKLERAPRSTLRDPEFRLRAREREGKQSCLELLERGGLEPPDLGVLPAQLERERPEVERYVGALSREGHVLRIGGIPFATRAVLRAASEVRDLADADGLIRTADTKARLGVSRKYLIPLLEYFDRNGYTRRAGEHRILGPKAPPSPSEPEG